MIYVVAAPGALLAIDHTDGSQQWQYSFGDGQTYGSIVKVGADFGIVEGDRFDLLE